MDSKNIFIACYAYLQKVTWNIVKDNNEWFYIGYGEQFLLESAQNQIDKLFFDDEIYLVLDRHTSTIVEKTSAAKTIKSLQITEDLSLQYNVILCDKQFKAFFAFNHVSTARIGTTA